MPQRRSLSYVLLIAFLVVLPTAVALLWYRITGDPNLRPLGITEQALRAYSGSDELEIVVVIDWVQPQAGALTPADLSATLGQAFRAKGVDVHTVYRAGQGATRVTYLVGETVLGPFPIARARDGIVSAVEAYKMH